MQTSRHARMYVCKYVRTYVRAYVCMCGCMHVCMHACIHVCACVYYNSSLKIAYIRLTIVCFSTIVSKLCQDLPAISGSLF